MVTQPHPVRISWPARKDGSQPGVLVQPGSAAAVSSEFRAFRVDSINQQPDVEALLIQHTNILHISSGDLSIINQNRFLTFRYILCIIHYIHILMCIYIPSGNLT